MGWIDKILNEILTESSRTVTGWVLAWVSTKVSLYQGLNDAADKLRRTHNRVQSLLIDAESLDIEQETVRRWVCEMKAWAFNAENHIDEFRTLSDVIKHAKEAPSRKRKRPVPSLGPLVKRYRIATDIAKIESRLVEIHEDRRNLRLKPSDGQRRSDGSNEMDSVPSVATFDESRIVGRSKECESVVAALKADSVSNLHVVVIYGLAGIGKTTLAQLVCKHFSKSDREASSSRRTRTASRRLQKGYKREGTESVSGDEGYFDMKIWVSMTNAYDVVKATKEIIKEITGEECRDQSFDHMQNHLKELVKGKRFLLVLDNFCSREAKFWESLCLPLLKGAKGSQVLITAQNDGVSRGMTKLHLVPLQGLQKDDCCKLFSAIAFPQANGDVDQKLKDISESIVDICQGSPLATISLGELVKSETNVDNWKTICNQMLENNSACPILRSFMASYHQLDYQWKQCFAFCSIFPDNYEFDKDELIRMWTAQGWVQSMSEADGSMLLNSLRAMSFVVECSTESCPSKTKCKYTMPNLIRRLACSLSQNELLVMEDNELNPPSGQFQFRYASLFHRKDQILFEKLYDQVSLRVLKLFNKSETGVGRIPEDLFKKLKDLWLLDLSNSGIEELPDSVGKLVHLRYLGLAGTSVKKLPESVENLYNLQTLELKCCYKLSSLPRGTSNLVNLRHLILHLCWKKFEDLSSMPTGINYLTSLKTLSRFTVTKEDGCNLRELKDLDLHGELCICKLENVTKASDAEEANLKEKDHIDKLMLRWSNGTSSVQLGADAWKAVADGLQPHKYLKCLWILNYPGSAFPDWLGNTSFSSIETVRLSCSEKCESLPLLGQLPKLKHLHIEGMKKLRNLESMKGFPSLETLTIKDMPVLETFCEFVDGEFPELIQIAISGCPNLPDTDRLNIPGRINVSRN
ncbi:putative disease resistance protein RGA3 [Curcuma longa]|uniref:putative disease resistance protein RGA3 n=1 Tax=Curcuma longa TaxID=136217 RepID=UPI003D9F38D3